MFSIPVIIACNHVHTEMAGVLLKAPIPKDKAEVIEVTEMALQNHLNRLKKYLPAGLGHA